MAKEIHTQSFNISNLSKLVSDGKIFTVEFVKRSTGELRKMTCRVGVHKGLKGGNQHYNPKQKGLLSVFDMEHQGYRSIPVEGIRRLVVSGQTFVFEQPSAVN